MKEKNNEGLDSGNLSIKSLIEIQKRIIELKQEIAGKEKEIHKRVICSQPHLDLLVEKENEPLKAELDQLESQKNFLIQTKTLTATKFLIIVTLLVSFGVAFGVPMWEKRSRTREEITFLYRSIVANEDVFGTNLNNREKFKNSTDISNLPEDLINYNIGGDLHEILQKKLGLINYRFLLYYLNQTRFLNDLNKELSLNLIENGPNSNEYKNTKQIYLETLDYLNGEKLNTKFNYFSDTDCLLYILHKSFNYLTIDKRNEGLDCSNDSLNRIFYWFGYLPDDTPDWLAPRLKEAVKERGVEL